MTLPALADNATLIALGVLIPGAMLAGPTIYKRCKAERKKKADMEKRRDETLEQVVAVLKDISGDVKCLFRINETQLDALEVTLRALHGEKVNGNVDAAIKKIQDAKMHLSGRLLDKVGDDL